MARRLGVSRDDVVAAAVGLTDDGGLEALTVAAVADAVGCRPPSVYHHVDGLAGLSRAVALAATLDLVASIEQANDGLDGMPALTAVIEASRAWGRAHPHRLDALQYHDDVDDPELAGARVRMLLLFQDAVAGLGIPAEERPPLVALLLAALRGAVERGLDPHRYEGDGLEEARDAGRDLLVRLCVDHLAAVADRARTR